MAPPSSPSRVSRGSEVRIARAAGDRRAPPWLDGAFGLHRHERAFVRALLERHPELWVFRPESTRACGDFVLVDMAARLERRDCLVLELKARRRLRVGSRHVQLAARDEAVVELASRGVVSRDARVVATFGELEVAQVGALLREGPLSGEPRLPASTVPAKTVRR